MKKTQGRRLIDILVRAFELATDDLSPERRKDLLTGENE